MWAKAWSLGKVLLTGETVTEERMKARLAICEACPKHKIEVDEAGETTVSCGICECKVSGDKRLFNLARFEETNDSGCFYNGKHLPIDRRSQWRINGV